MMLLLIQDQSIINSQDSLLLSEPVINLGFILIVNSIVFVKFVNRSIFKLVRFLYYSD